MYSIYNIYTFVHTLNVMSFKRLILLLIFFCSLNLLYAQEGRTELYLSAGNNTVFGNFTAVSFKLHSYSKKNFSFKAGAQYNYSPYMVFEVRPGYSRKFSSCRLTLEGLLYYTPRKKIHNVAAGVGIGLDTRYINISLGYYYRAIAGKGSYLGEPFNIYYDFAVNCLPNTSACDLKFSISNSRMMELERHYQPSFAIDCWLYPFDRLGTVLGICYKPAGMFNLSSDYYQFYANLGVCYKW